MTFKSKKTSAQMAWLRLKSSYFLFGGFVWGWEKETLRAIRILKINSDRIKCLYHLHFPEIFRL